MGASTTKPEGKQTIQVKVSRELVRKDNGWTLLLVSYANHPDSRFTMSGKLLNGLPMVKSQTYEVTGTWTQTGKYAGSFNFESYEVKLRKDGADDLAFLSGAMFPGIGPKAAKKIIEAYKDSEYDTDENGQEKLNVEPKDIITKIVEDQDPLIEAVGLKKADMVYSVIQTSEVDLRLVKEFNEKGIDVRIIDKMHEEDVFGKRMERILRGENTANNSERNLYEWSFNTDTLDFNVVDFAVSKLDPKTFATERDKWVVLNELKQALYRNNDTWIDVNTFGVGQRNILAPNVFIDKLVQLQNEHLIKIVGDKLTLNVFYNKEKENAEILTNTINLPTQFKADELAKINEVITEVEHEIGIDFHYDEEQRQAIIDFLANNVLVLQGPAGTGKSKVVQGMVKVYHKLTGKKSTLLAPTGKAANRLNEIDQSFKASTIHSFFHQTKSGLSDAINSDSDQSGKKESKQDCSVIIVDEASMLDIFTLNMILTKASFEKLVFVGDINQLPSVNVGDVLWDLNLSPRIQKSFLTNIHRTAGDNGIIKLATMIKDDQIHSIEDLNGINNVKNMLDKPVMSYVESWVKHLKTKDISFDDWQLLAPTYQSVFGIDNLNTLAQSLYHSKTEIESGKTVKNSTFTTGDKILFTKNDSKTGRTNGETGIITEMHMKTKNQIDMMKIKSYVDNSTLKYLDNKIFEDINLGYACSIHKSQGSEYKEVGVVVDSQGGSYMDKRNVYTAITRSKQNLVLFGDSQTFIKAIQKQPVKRNTFLLDFLNE